MAAIDIGSAAIDRAGTAAAAYTLIAVENPANLSGKITSIEIWAATDLVNCEVATFYVVSGTNFSTRSTQSIGAVTAGSKQTFAVDLDVQAGDYIGIYYTAGTIERDSAGSGYWTVALDAIPCTNQAFTLTADRTMSLYGTGATVEAGNAIFFGTNF